MSRISSPWIPTYGSHVPFGHPKSRSRGLAAEHEDFRRHFEAQAEKGHHLLCSEHHAASDGLVCTWKAWSTSPKVLQLAERAHEAACPSKYCALHRQHQSDQQASESKDAV